jgi:hypothetical protein
MNYEQKYLKYKKKYSDLQNEIQHGGVITKPWSTDSNLFYIAVVIDPMSSAGKEINHRTNSTAYLQYGSGKLHCPHITLLQIFIKKSTPFEFWIRHNLHLIYPVIQRLYIRSFGDKQIHSAVGHYDNLGDWCVRKYDDNSKPALLLDNIKEAQATFRRDINNYLLLASINKFGQVGQSFLDYITVERDKDPISPMPNPQKFIHYSYIPSTDSVMAEGSFVTDKWEPHVSLQKTIDPKKFIKDFTSSTGTNNMSWISLWGSQTTVNGHEGSIGSIFVSYAGVDHWIPIL